jgi:hypothetical protein
MTKSSSKVPVLEVLVNPGLQSNPNFVKSAYLTVAQTTLLYRYCAFALFRPLRSISMLRRKSLPSTLRINGVQEAIRPFTY